MNRTVTRIFTLNDQERFAALSRDYNPLHLDYAVARRTQFGGVLVHGVHGVLWALEILGTQVDKKCALTKIVVNFPQPLRLGQLVSCEIQGHSNHAEIKMSANRELCTYIVVHYESASTPSASHVNMPPPRMSRPDDFSPAIFNNLDDLEGMFGQIDLDHSLNDASSTFDSLKNFIPENQICALLASTEIVGMKCPGLRSIYSGLNLEFSSEVPPAHSSRELLKYSVKKVDPRFRMVTIEVKSESVKGELQAFLRSPASDQESLRTCIDLLEGQEYPNMRALVVGGSRGLGEIATKLLAASKADIVFTYHSGKADAERILNEINESGLKAIARKFDVVNDNLTECLPAGWLPTHLFYFPTPFIESGLPFRFKNELFQVFLQYYVTGFAKVVNGITRQTLKGVFYPSTSYLDTLPKNYSEYTAAKSAGETFCKSHAKVAGYYAYIPRLKMLKTDQTNQVCKVTSLDSMKILMTEIHKFLLA
jgi:MaoC like domain